MVCSGLREITSGRVTEMDEMNRRLYGSQGRGLKDVGGTSGGLGSFVLGALMAAAGGYLLLNQVTVTTGFWTFFGYNAFGLSLVPLLFGMTVIVPPPNSSGFSFCVRAASASREISAASCHTFLSCASRMTGTVRPASVCAAMPRWTRPDRVTTPASSS